METTIEELLLAAELREVAASRIKARLPDGFSDEERAQAFATQGNAVIAEVLSELDGIARLVRTLRAQPKA